MSPKWRQTCFLKGLFPFVSLCSAFSASQLYELLDFGVEVYKYNNGFIHSKLIIVDDEVITTGTANFDYRSFYQNFEINVNIYEKDVATTFREIFHEDIKLSSKLLRSEYSKRGYYIKFKESVCRLLAPIM